MVGHARLACDEARHWLSGWARAEQVSQREEVKGAASENKNSIADRFPGGLKIKQVINSTHKRKDLGVLFICFINVNGRWRAQSHPGGHASPNEPPPGLRVPGGTNYLIGLRSEGEIWLRRDHEVARLS